MKLRMLNQEFSLDMFSELQRNEMGAAWSFLLIQGNFVNPLAVYKSWEMFSYNVKPD
jgi:hypothetical protein